MLLTGPMANYRPNPSSLGAPDTRFNFIHLQDPAKSLPFCSKSVPLSDRVDDLIGRLTLDEKVKHSAPTVAAALFTVAILPSIAVNAEECKYVHKVLSLQEFRRPYRKEIGVSDLRGLVRKQT